MVPTYKDKAHHIGDYCTSCKGPEQEELRLGCIVQHWHICSKKGEKTCHRGLVSREFPVSAATQWENIVTMILVRLPEVSDAKAHTKEDQSS